MPGLRTLQRRMLGYLRQMFRGSGHEPAGRQAFPRLYDSQLETRRVLNADAPNAASQWLAVVLDAGTHANDGQADRFEIAQSQIQGRQEITVSINDRQVWHGAAEQLQSLRLQGSSDSDHFTIDPSIQFAGAIAIDGGVNRIDAADVIYVRPTGGESFHSVTVQDRPGSMQLRYSLIDAASESSASSRAQTLWQVSHVSQIVDYTIVSQRSFELTHRDTWQLTSTHDEAGSSLLQLSSSDQRYQFSAPTDSLHLSSHSTNSQQLVLRDLDLSSIGYVRLEGDSVDSIVQQGWLGSSRHFSVATGSVELQGMIQSSSATQLTVHGSSIIQSGLIQLGAGSSAVLDSGPTGRTIIQGQLKILGDAQHAGGSITITGGIVRIDDQALIDVSGISGGGQVLIGGDRAGANPLVRNAHHTTLSAGARISADALASGNGGRIIVYATDRAIVDNASGLSARGGSMSGNGGFIETSGKRHLTLNGSPIVSAAAGRAGQWLIDPEAVSIVTAVPAIPDPNITYITVASLQALINAGGDVIIQTATANPALGDIVIEAAVLATPGVSARLILQAARDIVFNDSFTGNANLGLELEAGRDVDALAVSITGVNYLKIQSGRDVYLDDTSLGSGSANAGTALSIVAIDTIDLSGDLITTGGHITLSGARLLVDGTAPRTIASGGSGVTANTAGNINLSGLTEIDGSVSPADLTIDARGVLNGGTVRLASVSNAVQGIRNLTVDTRGATTTGQLILDNGIAASTTIVVSGNLNFANANTQLADNVILTTQQNTSTLTLGSVATDGSARNLQLTSDANINIASVNLTGGSFTARVDANNDGINAFTSTGALAAGSLQFNGSAANNDTLSAQSTLTSTVGAIAFNNFSLIQLAGDSTSQTSFTATNVATVALLTSADVFASGAINLDSTITAILLGGASGSQNILDASGTNAAINLAAVTSTNANVDLAIRSDRSVTLKSMTLNGAQVDVQFSRNNPANDSIASFTATVTCDGLTVTGASRTNDGVGFAAPVSLGAAGLSVTQVAGTLIAGSITTTTGNLTIASDNSTGLAGDLTTAGGNITLSGASLFVEGSAPRTITSGGSGLTANTAGNINLSGLLAIDGAVSPADLTINARGVLNGGTVRLASVTNTTFGIRNLTVDTRGSSTTGQLILDNGIAASTTIVVSGNLDFANANTQLADNVVLTTQGNTSSLTLGSVATDGAARNLQLTSDANINTGSVNLTGGALTAQVDANNDGVNSLTSTGAIAAGSLQFNGSAANNDTLSAQNNLTSNVGAIAFNNFSKVELNGDSTSQTNFTATNVATVELGSNADIFTTGAINLDSTVTGILLAGASGTQNILDATGTNAAINLAAITSTNANVDLAIRSDRSVTLKSITLNGAQVDVQFSRNNPANNSNANFTAAVTSDGLTVTGAARTNDSVVFSSPLNLGAAGLNVSQVATTQVNSTITTTTGNLAITSATSTTLANNLSTSAGSITINGALILVNDIVLTKQGNSGQLTLGSVATDGAARNLQLTSDANINTGSVNLTGGSFTAQVDANNDGVNSFTSTGAIAAGSLQFNGSAANNDTLAAQNNLTSTVGAIAFNNFSNVQLNGDSTSQTSLTATNVTTVELGSNADIFTTGAINLDSTVTGILLAGTSGSQNILDATGTNAAINLAAITATNSNVDLAIRSDRSVTLKSVTLNGAQVDVQFSRNNPANNSSANFTAAVTSDGLTVIGAARTNDTVTFSSPLSLATSGLSVTQVATTQVNGSITTTTGNLTLNSATLTTLAGNLTTAGGNIALSGARLLVDGSAPRTIASGGSGVTAGTAGNINLSGLTEIDGSVSPADLTIDARGVLNGGTVRLASLTNAVQGIRNLTVDTRGATTTGQLILDNGLAASTTIVVVGNLNFANANTSLADNVVLTTQGNTSSLTLGSVATDGSARNLQLTSDANINTGSVNLTGGALTAQVDANNDGVNSLTSTGAIAAGSLQFNGSAANNDTLSAQNNLTSTVGAISFNNFSNVQLNGDSTSQTSLTATNVTTVELGSNADIFTTGAINLDSTVTGIRLAGTSGTQNILDATGTNAAINLAAITATNSNVDLAVRSDRSVTLKSIALNGAQVDVQFSRNNPANNSSANFTAAVTSDGLTVTGAARTNDSVVFSSPLNLGAAGLDVSQVATTQVNSTITTTTGNLAITSATSTTLANNLSTSAGSITINGALILVNDIVLTKQGNSGQLTLGSVATDGAARNLQLVSDANINTGSVNLTGGSLTAQVDANNDGVHAFTSTGAIAAGSLQFNGSAANNDTLAAQNNLTSTVGAIAFNNFSNVQLNGDSTSQTSLTATNVTTVELGSNADIFTTGAINLDSTVTGILLAGASGTQNILDATGTNAAINLAAITSTNTNVDLAIRSDRSVTLKSITLNGAQVDVQFSRNNPANNSSANFTAAVTSDGLTVIGAARTNDAVTFSSPLSLATSGLSVTQVATTQVNGSITTTTGNLTLNSTTLTTLAGNLTTAGGNMALSGARLLVDGSAPRTIASGGSGVTAGTAGNINLSGLTEIDGSVAPADLTIDARGVLNGGTVRLASVTNAAQGIRNLTVDTRGATTTGQLILDNGIAASTTILVVGNLNFANANTQLADNVVLTTQGNTSSLTLGSVATDGVARNLQLTSNANINTGSVNLTGGSLTAQVDANNDGVNSFTSTGAIAAGSQQFNGSAANNDTLSAQNNLTSTVGAISFNNFSNVQLNGDSTSQTNFTATNVATVELGSNADIFTTGAINLDSTVTGIRLAGTSGTQNILDATGTNAAINLAAITATNANVDLAVRSDRSVTLKSITLNGAQVDVQFSRNNPANNSNANFTAAVTSDGLTVTGAARTNDSVIFSSPLNLGAAGLDVAQVATVQINGDVNTTGSVVINQVSNRIQLIQNGRIIASGNINLRTGVSLIELTGASGTLNQISSSGDSATVQLAGTISALGVNLDVLSNHSIVLGSVDLGTTGSLRLEIDRNNNNASSQLTAGALRAHSLTTLGSANQDDTAVFSGTLRSEMGSITLSQFSTVTLNSDLTSATGVVVSNIAQQLRLGTSTDLLASNGNLNLLLGTGQIVSTGTAGSTNVLDARGAMNLSSLSSLNSVQIVLLANSDIQLAGANLPGSLSITAGNNGALTGQIESSSRLTAASLTLTSATGIGSTNELLTGASSLSATNRISGDIRIGNQQSSTDVLQLRTEAGGDILFSQTGGPATFHRVESFADGTPAVDENRVELSVTGADLNVATTGLIANGIGRVNLKTVSSGSISLQADTLAEGSDVLMQSAANIMGTGLIRGKTLRFEASSAIGGPTALRTQTTQLSSLIQSGTTNIANSSATALNVSELRSQAGGAILLRQTGGGDALIGSIVTGALSVSGAPNIQVINDAGSLIVNGMISAGGQGAINLQSQVDLVLSSTSLLATNSETALIEGNAVGRIQFQTGAVVRAGTGTPATEAVMTQIPPLITVIAVINSIGVNVDTDGLGVIDILLLPSGIGILDQNYLVIIDWGGGEIDRLPLGPFNANTPATGIARFDASPVPYRISHLYLQNPNTSDPSADIPVRVTAQVDSLNRIRFTDSQAIDQQLSASADTLLEVPATGLVSLYFVLPQTPTIQKQLAFARDNTEQPATLTLANDRSELVATTSTTSSAQQQRKIVLRVMIPVDEFGRVEASKDPKDDIALSPEDLTNLDSLFERLSDNRYRIYLILEDGNEILLKDILLRNHQPAEVEDSSNLSEIDHSQIPLLDDAPPASDKVTPSVQSNEANSAGLFDEDNDRQPAAEESSGMFRSWRKAARRFRAG